MFFYKKLFYKKLGYFSVNHPPRKSMVRTRVRVRAIRAIRIKVRVRVMATRAIRVNPKIQLNL